MEGLWRNVIVWLLNLSWQCFLGKGCLAIQSILTFQWVHQQKVSFQKVIFIQSCSSVHPDILADMQGQRFHVLMCLNPSKIFLLLPMFFRQVAACLWSMQLENHTSNMIWLPFFIYALQSFKLRCADVAIHTQCTRVSSEYFNKEESCFRNAIKSIKVWFKSLLLLEIYSKRCSTCQSQTGMQWTYSLLICEINPSQDGTFWLQGI